MIDHFLLCLNKEWSWQNFIKGSFVITTTLEEREKQEVLISMIIPVYNVRNEITELLSQLQSKEFSSFELIFVNDGSTDDSLKILEDFEEIWPSNNFTILDKKNGGLSSARNAGLKVAKGKYVWFVDPDDLLNVNEIANIVLIIQNENPDYLQFNYLEFKTASEIKPIFSNSVDMKLIPRGGFFELLAKEEVRNFAWAHIIKRKIYEEKQIEFPTGVDFEDIATTYRLVGNSSKIIYVDTTLYFYRQRTGSIMKTPNIKSMRDLLKVANMIFTDEKTDIPSSTKAMLFENTLSTAINRTFEAVDTIEVKKVRKEAERQYLGISYPFNGSKKAKVFRKKILIKLKVYNFLKKTKLRIEKNENQQI